MVNITKLINNFLIENKIVNFDIIYNDLFPEDNGDALISRYDPSRANETEYIDGSAVGYISISYLCRSSDPETCRSELNRICEGLDNLRIIDTTDGTEYRIKAVSLPSFVSADENNNTYYTCDIAVTYDRKGE